MILQWISDSGPWAWVILGVVLLALEIVLPGAYLLWLGVAAIITGLSSFLLDSASFWIWQIQVVAFLVLSIISVLVGRRFFPANGTDDTDQPLLNQRERQLVGRLGILSEPLSEGRGRVRLGDTLWRVTGPDMQAGARVRVVDVKDGILEVVAE